MGRGSLAVPQCDRDCTVGRGSLAVRHCDQDGTCGEREPGYTSMVGTGALRRQQPFCGAGRLQHSCPTPVATARKDTLGKSSFSFLSSFHGSFFSTCLCQPASTISHLHSPSAPARCCVGGAGWGGSWRQLGETGMLWILW